MKTARLSFFFILPFFFNGELLAQKTLDGSDIVVPDQSSLVGWLANDGLLSLFLVVSLVCLLFWLFYMAVILLMAMETAKRTSQKSRPPHALPDFRFPRVEFGMTGFIQNGPLLVPTTNKGKESPEFGREQPASADTVRTEEPRRRT